MISPILQSQAAAWTPSGSLVPQGGAAAYQAGAPIQVQSAFVGLQIPFLPDFLEDQSLVGSNDSERLAEVLARQVLPIRSLWQWQNAAFSLRYVYAPSKGRVDIYLLARVLARDQAAGLASRLALDLKRLWYVGGLGAAEILHVDLLQHALIPFAQPKIAEVRQLETQTLLTFVRPAEVLPAQAPPGRGESPGQERQYQYSVHNLLGPEGTQLHLFAALLRLDSPLVVNIHLEPTSLALEESDKIAQVAARLATLADEQRILYSEKRSGRLADPQARQLAQRYAGLLPRLQRPFVMTIQVVSPDAATATSFAHLVGDAVTLTSSSTDTPPEFQVVTPNSPETDRRAEQTLHNLVMMPWGIADGIRDLPLRRLSYLVDARGAAAAFRFPVAVRGGIPGIEVRQLPPDFDPGLRQAVDPATLHIGDRLQGGAAIVGVADLARHALVAGLPGSGKTNTVLYLLDQLQRRSIPFLVVEPTKTEYRGLLLQGSYKHLNVFTAGDETTAPFRLNPFELQPNVRLEVHLEALNTAINAVMPQFGILPSILEEALEDVYAQHGWGLTDRAQSDERRLFPTMAEFYRTTLHVAEQRGYRGEMHSNIVAAVKGRIGTLLRGSKGKMFNCRKSLPFDVLFEQPVILELDSLNDDTKALTMMFLLLHLREYRQQQALRSYEQGSVSIGLQHVLVIEEAHRVMENVAAPANPEVAAETRARAVRSLVDMLVEMRSYGQGILIAEQSPQKLAPDAIRNTNLKIAHMLPGAQDRAALAAAMIMDEAQERFLGKLPVGQAAVFASGFEKTSFVQVPNFKRTVHFNDHVNDAVVSHSHHDSDADSDKLVLPFDGCRFCQAQCRHRSQIEPVTLDKQAVARLHAAMQLFDEHPEPEWWDSHWLAIAAACRTAAAMAGKDNSQEAAFCFLTHEVDFPFTPMMREAFLAAWTRKVVDLPSEVRP